MDQQGAKVGVATFGDPAKSGFATGGVLSGRQSDPCSELPTVLEVSAIPDHRNDGSRGFLADAVNGEQPYGALIVFHELPDLTIIAEDLSVNLVQFVEQLIQHLPGQLWNVGVWVNP